MKDYENMKYSDLEKENSRVTRELMKIEREFDKFKDGMQYDPKWKRLGAKQDKLLQEIDVICNYMGKQSPFVGD
jgi:hypothetical protein